MGQLAKLNPRAFEGLSGLEDLGDVLEQLRGLKAMRYSGAAVSAGVVGTLTRGDGTNNTLKVDALVPGTGGLFVEFDRRDGVFVDGNVFDMRVHYADPGIAAKTISAVNTGTEALTVTAHGLATGSKPLRALNSGGALPTGLASNVLYWPIVVDANTIKLATTRANAAAGTAVDITGAGSGTNTLRVMRTESFTSLSMADAAHNYVERKVNGKSVRVTVTDLDSAAAEARPLATSGVPVPLGSGANDGTLSGLKRGDHIAFGWNHTTGTLLAAEATDTDTFSLVSGSIALNDVVFFVVLPKPT